MYAHLLLLMVALGMFETPTDPLPPAPSGGGYRLRRFPRAS
jgi:hypothetical protein